MSRTCAKRRQRMCSETVTDMNFYDETTGELFNQRLVREAEDEELQRFIEDGCV